MTPGEVNRAIEARNKITRFELQERASMDYILAQLIVKGVGITLGDKSNYPTLEEVYPSLFTEQKQKQEEIIQQKKIDLSVLRFKQFAQSYNNRNKNKEVPK